MENGDFESSTRIGQQSNETEVAKGGDDDGDLRRMNNDLSKEEDWKEDLPEWIVTYLSWHMEMREKFPDEELILNPDAPKLLVRTCLGLCGGLVDRLGQLPWDVYLAARTNRILLLHWARPTPLEDYLVPNLVNFTVPIPNWFPPDPTTNQPYWIHRKSMKPIRAKPDLFQGHDGSHPTEKILDEQLETLIEKAKNSNEKIFRFQFLGHVFEDYLQKLIQQHFPSKDNKIPIDVHNSATYGKLFHIFFQPSPPLNVQLQQVEQDLGIETREFDAVHCRIRHPKSFHSESKIAAEMIPFLDSHGFNWTNEELRGFAINHALKALSCHSTSKEQNPIYFFSDTLDLAKFVVDKGNFTSNMSKLERDARSSFDGMNIVVRNDSSEKNRHIDREKFGDPPSYFGTFIDLYIAMKAKCITYGIGNFAFFASKLSATSCRYIYEKEHWGLIVSSKTSSSKTCDVQ